MLVETLSIQEFLVAKLTVRVSKDHVHLLVLKLVELSTAELALRMVCGHVNAKILSSVGGKLQRKGAPPCLHVKPQLQEVHIVCTGGLPIIR